VNWKLRTLAVLRIGAMWAMAWGVFGAVFYTLAMILQLTPQQQAQIERHMFIGHSIPTTAFVIGVICGFVAGAGFALLVAMLEHRRTLQDLTWLRMSAWGSLPGIALMGFAALSSGYWSGALIPAAILAVCGAGSAAGTLIVVRRAIAPSTKTPLELPAT